MYEAAANSRSLYFAPDYIHFIKAAYTWSYPLALRSRSQLPSVSDSTLSRYAVVPRNNEIPTKILVQINGIPVINIKAGELLAAAQAVLLGQTRIIHLFFINISIHIP